MINNIKCLVELYINLVNDAFLNYRVDISPSWDPVLQQEKEDIENELREFELKRECQKFLKNC